MQFISDQNESNKWLEWFLAPNQWDFTDTVWSTVSQWVLSIEKQNPDTKSPVPDNTSIQTKAFLLVLHGWKLQRVADDSHQRGGISYLWCSYCNRRQLLDKNVKSDDISDPLQRMMKAVEPQREAKRSCTNSDRFLTHCRDHRWFCAWVRQGEGIGDERQPGWKQCVQVRRMQVFSQTRLQCACIGSRIGNDEYERRCIDRTKAYQAWIRSKKGSIAFTRNKKHFLALCGSLCVHTLN